MKAIETWLVAAVGGMFTGAASYFGTNAGQPIKWGVLTSFAAGGAVGAVALLFRPPPGTYTVPKDQPK